MIISYLFTNPVLFFAWIIAIAIAISVHEFSHALAAYRLGDPTAKDQGRLTLNPLKHLDLFGTLLLLFVGFGWGKPVPFNPYNLKNQKFGPALVSLAGPFANLAVVIIFGIFVRILSEFTTISPENGLIQLIVFIILINIVLMIFNLIPIPPLDGSKVLFAVLPDRMEDIKTKLESYGPFILIGVILLDGMLGGIIFGNLFNSIINLTYRIIGI